MRMERPLMRWAPHSALMFEQAFATFSVYDLKNVSIQLAAEPTDEKLFQVFRIFRGREHSAQTISSCPS